MSTDGDSLRASAYEPTARLDSHKGPQSGKHPQPIVLDALLLLLGAFIQSVAYQTIAPFLLSIGCYLVAFFLLTLPALGRQAERHAFSRLFSVGILAAGVASVYAEYFADPDQLQKDAARFFEMATGQAGAITLEDLRLVHEGSLSIALWRAVYDALESLGFEKGRYIGVTVNVALVAISGVIGVRITRSVYGDDQHRLKRFTVLASTCGLFWLFGALHLRDALVLLVVTALAYSWIFFLAKPNLGLRLALVAAWNATATIPLGYLRAEYAFVPIAMAAAAFMALVLGRSHQGRRHRRLAMLAIGLIVITPLVGIYYEPIVSALEAGQSDYLGQLSEEHSASSLGMSLIINQPQPIRIIFGSAYLLAFPIPVWSGFQLTSAYALFKSLNALFFYFLIPMLALAVRQLAIQRASRTPSLLFLVITSLGFTAAIADTSLESRHLGAFLIPALVLALLPDTRLASQAAAYRRYLMTLLLAMGAVHGLWILLKVIS